MTTYRWFAALLLMLSSLVATGQEEQFYSRRNALSVSAAYANTSSHILLGISQNRRLADLGVAYSRRLVHARYLEWSYDLELHPLQVIQDPVATYALLAINGVPTGGPPSRHFPIQRACTSQTYQNTIAYPPGSAPTTYTSSRVCGGRWTYAGGVSPLGQRINFMPKHRVQPFAMGNAGFTASNRDIPMLYSSRFNFTFEFGVGVEWFRDHRHAWSAEYRLHHLSNDYVGAVNPGIDNQIVRVAYSFGR